MKHPNLLFFPAAIFLLISCRSISDSNQMLSSIQKQIDSGNLKEAVHLSESLKKQYADNIQLVNKADSLKQIAERIGLDFSITEKQAVEQLKKKTANFSLQDKDNWESKSWLEWRMINGEKMYFNRAVSNLQLLKKFYEQNEDMKREIANDPKMIFRRNHTEEVIDKSASQSNAIVPVNMNITYTITVVPDAVPAGDILRCWLPWPRVSLPRQQKISLISTSNQNFLIAPDTAIHSTIYMEEVSKKGLPVIFRVSFNYQSNAQYFNLSNLKILPYNKKSENYRKYTSEQLPHICFTANIKKLADSITRNEKDPEAIVKKIYYWFKENIPWTGALEYSIIPNIPEYVYQHKRGDCGMQTFMFMSMLRYKGVPVRWQSGWMVPPGAENLHDWCEVYYEGPGWVPVDVSYDLQDSESIAVKEFYLSGIDSYRLILNDGVAGPLHPEKQFLRSEPYDFQRGEVEWKGGNLYFNKWNYDMNIEYLQTTKP